ncbi:MAG: LpxI family protein [Candidatus Aminicenantes bacterium]|nr:LpxI family protein [Candidatus Aminicenantes bacterium]
MGPRIGLIAGSGELPLLALDEAARRGWECLVAGVRGEASPDLEGRAAAFFWLDPGRPEEAVRFFKEGGADGVLLAGKVAAGAYFRRADREDGSGEWLEKASDGRPASLIRTFIRFLEDRGLRVMDPGPFLAPFFCPEGVLTVARPSTAMERDAALGWTIARRMADLDIGQTVVVKDLAVAAVEAAEGTDAAIRRAGDLAGPGTVAVKVSRTRQDLRVDVPGVGLSTIRALIETGASALCLEAGRVAFFQRERAVELADQNGLVLFARGEREGRDG